MSESLEGILGAHPFLAGLPEGTAQLVAGCSRTVAFAPGQLLIAEGQAADTLYLLHHGRVAVEAHRSAGGSVSLETIGPGHLVGLSWATPPFRWQFDARALDPVSAVAIDVGRLRAELGRRPEIGFALLDRLTERLVDRLQAARLGLLDLHALGDDPPR
jgi:CRP/FNR family transcriptional regulator, cyclic AMP receptor protein